MSPAADRVVDLERFMQVQAEAAQAADQYAQHAPTLREAVDYLGIAYRHRSMAQWAAQELNEVAS